MFPYWVIFAFFAAGALHETTRRAVSLTKYPVLVLGGLLIAVLVGFRFEVGADWQSYEFLFSYARHMDFARAIEIGEPAYQFLNWSVQQLDADFWLVNLVCGTIFAWGLIKFAHVQPRPCLAVLVAIPYMVVVVAMGYSRQAVALGILMAGLATIERGGTVLRFAIYVAAAALFHKTAVVAFPLVALASRRSKALNITLAVAASLLLYDVFLGDSMEQFVDNYIKAEYSSQGAAILVVMSLVPAVIFFRSASRMGFTPEERLIWRNFSLAAVALLVLLLVLPSSTAVDRLALYIMPLQLAVLSRLPGSIMNEQSGKLAVIGYSFAVQFVWLNFAIHSKYWLPYQFFPL